MPGIQPTYGIIETGRNVRAFTKAHRRELWAIILPLLPWFVVLPFVDVIGDAAFPQLGGMFILGECALAYFYACLAISWHRVLLFGPAQARAMNPYKPEKSELAFFVLLLLLYSVIPAALGFGVGFLAIIAPVFVIVPIVAVIAFMYAFYKVSFYFPAKAVGADMSFKESFVRTKGYLAGLIFVPLLSTWRLMLAYFAYLACLGVGFMMQMRQTAAFEDANTPEDYEKIFTLKEELFICVWFIPVACYFVPLFYAYGVAAISNYYQHSLQIGPPKKRVEAKAS